MRTHLSFPTSRLDRSTDFYRLLLGAEPAKRHDDYVLFLTEEPPLELALAPATGVTIDAMAHFGIAVDRPESVDDVIKRLQDAGAPIDVETGEICCYARQNKVWARDPDGRRWEVYYVLEETDARDGDSSCCAPESACCAPA